MKKIQKIKPPCLYTYRQWEKYFEDSCSVFWFIGKKMEAKPPENIINAYNKNNPDDFKTYHMIRKFACDEHVVHLGWFTEVDIIGAYKIIDGTNDGKYDVSKNQYIHPGFHPRSDLEYKK